MHRLPFHARFLPFAAATVIGLAACATVGDRPPPALTTEKIAAVVADPDRSAADREADVRRKPVDMLSFIGVRPGMTVLDIFAGGGYTSELLARAVGPTGRVYAQSAPPRPDASGQTPARSRSATLVEARAKNASATNLSAVMLPYDHPVPAAVANGGLDLVTLMFNYHDFGSMGVDRDALNRAVFAGLKPGGTYVIADHAGRADTGISESGTLHRVEEAFVVREVRAAGFRLAERGEFLRNPNDPRDRETPEPPMAKDEFVLKFVKPS